jgi:hypothetical protein
MMLHFDFTKAETLRRLADLPRYGWAEALIRRVDPLWKAGDCLSFKVSLERGDEGCPNCGGACCGDYSDLERKTLLVDAASAESALDEAEQEMLDKGEAGWIARSATPIVCTAEVPKEYLAWFDTDGRA